jgi:uncharacterized repeat protein (TIGR03803 family)
MKKYRSLILSATAFALTFIFFTLATVTSAHAQTYSVLYNFGGVPGDPELPDYGPIAQGRDGGLYDTSYGGGSTYSGAVFKITTAGTLSALSSLGGDAGTSPDGGLVLGKDGNFYGATGNRGNGSWMGTVFLVTPSGKLRVLYSFSNDSNGAFPTAPPIQGADGSLYGTTNGLNVGKYGTI